MAGVESIITYDDVESAENILDQSISRFRIYHRVYEEAYGTQPWECYACGVPAELIHHLDHDHSNNLIENLQPLCYDCHNSHHHSGVVRSAETVEKIAASKRGKPRDEATKRKLSEALKGKPATKSAEARRARTHCKNDHPLDYVDPRGQRGCSTCRNEAAKRYRQRKKSQ